MAGLIADMSEEMQYAFQSSAEKALVQASGIRIPIQCWGAKGYTRTVSTPSETVHERKIL
jgi:hypothetical protein